MLVRNAAVTAIALLAASGAMAQEPISVYVEELALDNLEIVDPDYGRSPLARRFELDARELAGLQSMYSKAMERAVTRDDEFVMAPDAASSDVVVSAELVRISPLAPKDDFSSRGPREKIVSQGAGSAKIHFVVTDADGVVLDIENRRDAGRTWQENNRFNNQREVRRLFSRWASYALDEIADVDN